MSSSNAASQPLYFNIDVLTSIAEYLPWPTLVRFLSLPTPAPDVVRPETQRRIYARLVRFLRTIDIDDFFVTLENSGAIIVGSFIREIVLSGHEGSKGMKRSARDLNVLVERYREDDIRDLLEGNGFHPRMVNTRSEYKDCVYMVEEYIHEDDDERANPIRITVCEQSLIAVVLLASTTADLAFLTPYELILFYPRCILANECMAMTKTALTDEQHAVLQDVGLNLITTNEHWKKPCDWYCPMRIRKTFGDDGIVAIPWKKLLDHTKMEPWQSMLQTGWGSFDDGGEDVFAVTKKEETPVESTQAKDLLKKGRGNAVVCSEALRWTVWDRCYNGNCNNSRLYDRRRAFLEN